MAKNDEKALSGLGFLARLAAALVLVLLTFNPSGQSAYHWIARAISNSAFGPEHLILLAILLIGWTVYWIATWRALGTLGVTLSAILLGAVIWLLFDIGLLQSKSITAITWISLICLAFVLAIGVSWSHIWRRWTGQINVEDVDD